MGLCRQGEVSADVLQQQFALAFKSLAPDLFLELAELLPSPHQRAQLLSAASRAGWALPDQAPANSGGSSADLAARAPPQQGPDSWQPLDRSRLQEAASALAEQPVRVCPLYQVQTRLSAQVCMESCGCIRSRYWGFACLMVPAFCPVVSDAA